MSRDGVYLPVTRTQNKLQRNSVKNDILSFLIIIILLCVILFNITGCSSVFKIQAENLMAGVSANSVQGKSIDDVFIRSADKRGHV